MQELDLEQIETSKEIIRIKEKVCHLIDTLEKKTMEELPEILKWNSEYPEKAVVINFQRNAFIKQLIETLQQEIKQ